MPIRVIIVSTNERPSLEMKEAADRGKLLSGSFPEAACLWEPRTGAGAGKVVISDDEDERSYIIVSFGSGNSNKLCSALHLSAPSPSR